MKGVRRGVLTYDINFMCNANVILDYTPSDSYQNQQRIEYTLSNVTILSIREEQKESCR